MNVSEHMKPQGQRLLEQEYPQEHAKNNGRSSSPPLDEHIRVPMKMGEENCHINDELVCRKLNQSST